MLLIFVKKPTEGLFWMNFATKLKRKIPTFDGGIVFGTDQVVE